MCGLAGCVVAGDFKLGIGRWGAALVAALLLAVPLSVSQAASASQRPAVKAKATSDARQARPAAKPAAKPRKTVKRQVRRAPRRPPSVGTLAGLHRTDDPLDLKSAVALVVDQDTDEVLFSKNSDAVLPIASITKLMTALVVTEAGLPMDEKLTVTREDVRATSGSRMRSRLAPGTRLTRGELLHLALMSSENRAAYVLGRTYPGGIRSFIEAMNGKAQDLGMTDTRYVEPTGLSADNRSSAQDLAQLVRAASQYPMLRELSTMPAAALALGRRQVQFRNTVTLDLRRSEAELLAAMKQKTRYNVRLAQKKGVGVRPGAAADFPLLYRMYAETSVRDGFVIRSSGYYADVWGRLLEAGLAEELALRHEQLRPELEARFRHLEGCLGRLPEEQRSLIEGYYYRREDIGLLASQSGRTVAATYKTLQRIRQALQACMEGSPERGGAAP